MIGKKFFKILKYSVSTSWSESIGFEREAKIKIQVWDEDVYPAAEGDGPINAIDRALKKALLPFYPFLDDLRLTDYDVSISNGENGTGAKVEVKISSSNGKDSWNNTAVSTDVLEASLRVLVESCRIAIDKKLKELRKNSWEPNDLAEYNKAKEKDEAREP